MYWLTGAFGADPFAIARQNVVEIGDFLRQGNFRPLGRFIVYMEQTSIFEIAAGTGIAPHILQGILRLVMVSTLAVVATCFILALYRSAQAAGASKPLVTNDTSSVSTQLPSTLAAFPMVLASTIVVSGSLHPVSFFPFYYIAMTIFLLLISLYVGSEKAISQRDLGKYDVFACVLSGMVSAMTSEILYLVPVACVLTIVARGTLSRMSPEDMIRSAAARRFAALLAGFLVVFIPSRIAIAIECSRHDCYEGSEAVLSALSFEQWIGRAMAGLQWDTLSSTIGGEYDNISSSRSYSDFVTNVWLLFVVASMVYFAVSAGTRLARARRPDQALPATAQSRLGVALIAFGGVLALSTALMVSLSEGLQGWHERGFGLDQWRDSLLVQISWAFILYGMALAVLSHMPRREGGGPVVSRTLAVVATVLILVVSLNAFVANDTFAIWRRSDSVGSVVNLISTASVEFDRSDEGQAIRCELMSVYADRNCKNCWHSGERTLEELNNLSRSKHGEDFCPSLD